jgi:hypothetical protein
MCFILHVDAGVEITMNLLGLLILGLESLKATAYMINKKSEAFDTTILTKMIAKDMCSLLEPSYENLKRECENEKKNKDLFLRK